MVGNPVSLKFRLQLSNLQQSLTGANLLCTVYSFWHDSNNGQIWKHWAGFRVGIAIALQQVDFEFAES
jgi:hypothetical protein